MQPVGQFLILCAHWLLLNGGLLRFTPIVTPENYGCHFLCAHGSWYQSRHSWCSEFSLKYSLTFYSEGKWSSGKPCNFPNFLPHK